MSGRHRAAARVITLYVYGGGPFVGRAPFVGVRHVIYRGKPARRRHRRRRHRALAQPPRREFPKLAWLSP